jgi:hypothetical protein
MIDPLFSYLLLTYTYEAKLLQLLLTACCLARIVLNIWGHPRLPDGCYPVVDQPCWNGIHTRWNYRPGSAGHPLFSSSFDSCFLSSNDDILSKSGKNETLSFDLFFKN